MKNKTRLFGIYMPLFILLLLGALVLRTVALTSYFNFRFGYFTSSILPAIANALILTAIVFFIIYILAEHRKFALIPNFSSPANYIPSAAIAAALIFMIIHLLRVFINSENSISRWLALIIAIFGVLSVIYFALNSLFMRSISIRRANFGLCFVVFLSLYMAYLYFDSTTPINSPVKTLDQMAYLFSAVFFLYEIRLSLGREKWTLYILFGFSAAILSAYASIPALITYFVNGKIISDSIYETVLTFTLFLFTTLKLLLIDRLVDNSESPIVTALRGAAARRIMEMMPETSSPEQEAPEQIEENEEDITDENQISIMEISNSQKETALEDTEAEGTSDNDDSETLKTGTEESFE